MDAQTFHHPDPTTPLAATTVTDTMKVCPFCNDSTPNHQIHFHGDTIHLHIHCTNTQPQLIRDASNTDSAMVLKYLGALFQHVPYDLTTGCEPFQSFLSGLLHQYDVKSYHDTSDIDNAPTTPFNHSTIHLRTHRSITSSVIEWARLRPHMNEDSPKRLTYTHGLSLRYLLPTTLERQ